MKNDGVPKFADESETNQRIAALEERLRAAEATIQSLTNITIDPASGGGVLTMGNGTAILRINSLTNESAQMP